MIWFVKVRTPWWLVAVAAAVTALGIVLAGVLFPVPSFGLGLKLPMTLGMFIPSLAACAALASITQGTEREVRARRASGFLDVGWAIGLTFAATAPYLMAALLGANGGVASARNCLGFVGVGLLSRRILRGAAVCALPALFAMVTAVISSTSSSALIAWPYLPGQDDAALTVGFCLWVLGLAVGTGRSSIAAQLEAAPA